MVTRTYSEVSQNKTNSNHLVQRNRQLLGNFHLNGHTLGFRPQTQTLGPETFNLTASKENTAR